MMGMGMGMEQTARSLLQLGRDDEATEVLGRVFALNLIPSLQQTDLRYVHTSCAFHCGQLRDAYESIRAVGHAMRNSIPVWNSLSRVLVRYSEGPIEYRQLHRFALRMYQRDVSSVGARMIVANNHLSSGKGRHAIPIYLSLMREFPEDALIPLCMSVSFLTIVKHRKIPAWCRSLVQALAYFEGYKKLRSSVHHEEILFNMGRFFHTVGMKHWACVYYQKVLDIEHIGPRDVTWMDREAAFNLANIHTASGNKALARSILMKHIRV
jgi:hypothetical protein